MERRSTDRVYKEVLEGYPYNGLARVLRLQGQGGGIPVRFGGSCREQVRRLMDGLREDEGCGRWQFQLPYDPMAVHNALIAEREGGEEDEGVFMDPSLMLLEPVRLCKIPEKPQECRVETYPWVEEIRGSAELSRGLQGINVRWATPILRPEGSVRLIEKKNHAFTQKLEPAHFLPDPSDAEATRAELQWNAGQKSQYWNVLDPQRGELITLRFTMNGVIEARSSERQGPIRAPESSLEPLKDVIRKITDITRTSTGEVSDFLQFGREKFVELVRNRAK